MTERRVKKGWMNLKVSRVIDETWDTKTFLLEDLEDGGRQWDYTAGQYLTFRYDDISEKPIVRSYTMSSSPIESAHCAVTVKRVEGGKVSNWMCDTLKVGSVLRARGPIGKFVYDARIDRKHLVMVGAGSGVTPFVSIMREYADRLGSRVPSPDLAPERMTLLVSYRSRKDLILWSTIEDLSKKSGCRIVTTLSRDLDAPREFWQGRISDDMLSRLLEGQYQDCTVMTCGPQQMMDLVREHCASHGMPQEQIKDESFES